jgi:hypothetical protein
MNFTQWKTFISKNSVPKVVYCCGDQLTLVELVIEDIKQALATPIVDYVELTANSEVWESATEYPLDITVNRLTVVRNAEDLKDWKPLNDWLLQTRANPNNYLLFVTTDHDAPGIYVKGKKTSYVDHVEIIRSKGKFIRCNQPNDDDLIAWAQGYGLSRLSADHLIQRTSGDVAGMLQVLRKIHVWNGSPNPKALDLLCDEQALDLFSDYLILRDKRSAFLALNSLSEEDKVKMISRIDSRLDLLTEIGKYVRQRVYAGDIAAKTGINVYLIKKFTAIVKEYDDRKIKYCRQLLTMVDGTIRDGAKVGVWETLITLW